jgi:predicted Zn-dependent protease with MMP-like domain
MHLDDEEFELVVEDAIASIPEGFKRYLENVVVDVEDEPDENLCRRMRLRDPRCLLGVYEGTPLTDRHVEQPYRYPDRIIIFQRNIERISRSRAEMIEQIRKTVLHEVGHHFGLSERQLRQLGF